MRQATPGFCTCSNHSGVLAVVACRTHNPEVAGSIPAPATCQCGRLVDPRRQDPSCCDPCQWQWITTSHTARCDKGVPGIVARADPQNLHRPRHGFNSRHVHQRVCGNWRLASAGVGFGTLHTLLSSAPGWETIRASTPGATPHGGRSSANRAHGKGREITGVNPVGPHNNHH